MGRSFRKWFLGVTTIIALFALLAATFAWFSSNRAVSTSTASARTGEENLELQISSIGESDRYRTADAGIHGRPAAFCICAGDRIR